MDFAIGGFAAIAAGLFSNPFDVIKTRQQLQGELVKKGALESVPYKNIYESIKSIIKAEGVLGLQKGLSSALAFQFVMNSVRLGTYQTFENKGWTRDDSGQLNQVKCMFYGGIAGVFGSSIASPLYMIKTQMQAESALSKYAVGYQHHHKSTIKALVSIFKERGVPGLWRGFTGIVPRTAVGSSVQLSTFSRCKDILLEYEFFVNSHFATAFAASMVSGFFTTVFMTPFDTVATRLFNQGVDPVSGKGLMYRNIFDCFYKTFKVEGIHGLYKGFGPNYFRIAPHTILNLTFWEQFKKWKDLYLSDDSMISFE